MAQECIPNVFYTHTTFLSPGRNFTWHIYKHLAAWAWGHGDWGHGGFGLAILLCVQSVKVNKKICLPTFGVICKHQRECQRKHVHESKGSRVALRIRAEIFYVCGMPKSHSLSPSPSLGLAGPMCIYLPRSSVRAYCSIPPVASTNPLMSMIPQCVCASPSGCGHGWNLKFD